MSSMAPRHIAALAAVVLLAAAGCDGLFTPAADGGSDDECPGGCPTGQVCRDGECMSTSDPCTTVYCPPGQRCEGGTCFASDPCEGVVCPNPGEICQAGVCVVEDEDRDGDGFVARADCDDTDEAVYPGATEACNGVDDDCDATTEDGVETCPGQCCGSPAACQTCCTGGQCGTGDWSCTDGECECDGIVDGERCIGGAECTPEDIDTGHGDCGMCGTRSRSRTCLDSGTWGSWGDWGSCLGEGACSPGSRGTDTEDCGWCGDRSRSRTCSDECEWGGWSTWGACAGEGVCSPGTTDTDTGSCGCVGSRNHTRTCLSTCYWGGFQMCTCSSSGYWISCSPGCIM